MESVDEWIERLNNVAKVGVGAVTAYYGARNQVASTKAASDFQRQLLDRSLDLQVAQLNAARTPAALPAWGAPANQAPPVIVSGGGGGGGALELSPAVMLAGAALVLLLLARS